MQVNNSKRTLIGVRKLLAGTAMATALTFVGLAPALAASIPLGGYTGPIMIKFSNFESFTGNGSPDTPGNNNFGIFEVTTIEEPNGTILYQAPLGTPTASNPLIVGLFSGIDVSSATGVPPTETVFATGGTFNLYDDTTTPFGTISAEGVAGYTSGGCLGVNTQCFNLITNQGFNDILNLSLVAGASTADPAATVVSTLSVNSGSEVSGESAAWADITGGSDTSQFGKGGEMTPTGAPADIALEDDFCSGAVVTCATPPVSSWGLGSQDPIRTNIVPEPASLALFGVALLGLGWFRRRKQFS